MLALTFKRVKDADDRRLRAAAAAATCHARQMAVAAMYVDYDPADNARETGFTSVENLRLDRVPCCFLISKDFHGPVVEEEEG